MFWITTLISALFPSISKLLDKFIPDANDRLAAKRELIYTAEQVLESKKEIILAEVQSEHWLQRSWRPIVGWAFSIMAIFILFSTSILRPYIYFFSGVMLPEMVVSPQLWYAVFFCLGGYMTLRSVEKICRFLKF